MLSIWPFDVFVSTYGSETASKTTQKYDNV